MFLYSIAIEKKRQGLTIRRFNYKKACSCSSYNKMNSQYLMVNE